MIIVIDGPAGSGKSSTAKAIANSLHIQFLDSGALYRALTYLWLRRGKPDKAEFFENLSEIELQTDYSNQVFHVQANGENITDKIRLQEVANHVSEIASDPRSRSFVNGYMKKLVAQGVFVADGRDLGTAVFPDAELKFYMDASLDERAARRFKEIEGTENDVTLEQVKQNLAERDHKDSNRKSDPLRKAEDAIVVDTSGKSFEEQLSEMLEIIDEELKLKP
ncbi:(d)CMP kinase [Rhodohalobacter mucosus]|uniref:Cytidylate kinase n=1 Tax=Rhodohalobacter mucosus TaxID=2079485 RepID=A0A316TS90_9BACT|nr:(d)CMP kinase [Rhodohalobacter mucosus]PWN06189.1 (d)CMP kinase [Rhodohalobacter mucosus]